MSMAPNRSPRISLGALLAGWAMIVLWICWIQVATRLIDGIRQQEQAEQMAKSAPLH
jgi:hypothetical protein